MQSAISSRIFSKISRSCTQSTIALLVCLPFLVPFDATRNIDLQGGVLIIAGGLAWLALLTGYRETLGKFGRMDKVLVTLFMICCLISLAVNPHFGYDLFGAPYIRLGSAGLLACVGIGLDLLTVSIKRLVTWLYIIILGLALVSVPYTWLHFHSLVRIGGLFSQADIMACCIGCGLLLGVRMLAMYPKWRVCLLGGQAFLVVLLLLTQTRAALVLVTGLWLIWIWQHRRHKALRLTSLYLLAALSLLALLHSWFPDRLTNSTYASESISYRLTLQDYALKASWQKPIFGYGPGNLADALSCQRLTAAALQRTCHQGFFFNSSHNIFIDRVLAIGWIGGLTYLVIVGRAIYRGLSGASEVRIFGYLTLLISLYYLTNVTSATLELLLWIVMLRCLANPA